MSRFSWYFLHYKECFNFVLAILNNLLWNIATYIFLHRGWYYFKEQSTWLASIFACRPSVGGSSKVSAFYLTPLLAPPRGLSGNCSLLDTVSVLFNELGRFLYLSLFSLWLPQYFSIPWSADLWFSGRYVGTLVTLSCAKLFTTRVKSEVEKDTGMGVEGWRELQRNSLRLSWDKPETFTLIPSLCNFGPSL